MACQNRCDFRQVLKVVSETARESIVAFDRQLQIVASCSTTVCTDHRSQTDQSLHHDDLLRELNTSTSLHRPIRHLMPAWTHCGFFPVYDGLKWFCRDGTLFQNVKHLWTICLKRVNKRVNMQCLFCFIRDTVDTRLLRVTDDAIHDTYGKSVRPWLHVK